MMFNCTVSPAKIALNEEPLNLINLKFLEKVGVLIQIKSKTFNFFKEMI